MKIRRYPAMLAIIMFGSLGVCTSTEESREDLGKLIQVFRAQSSECVSRGIDISDAVHLDKQSREAMRSGDRTKAVKFLEDAITLLEEKGVSRSVAHSPGVEEARPEKPGGRAHETGLGEPSRYSVAKESFESPFGIFGPYEFEVDERHDGITVEDANAFLVGLGVAWVQVKYWDANNVPERINVYSRIGREGRVDSTRVTDAYRDELRKVISAHKRRIKLWEVGTEPDGLGPPQGWKDSPDAYAEFLKETYRIIKSEDADATVVFGGLGGVGSAIDANSSHAAFLRGVLKAGGGAYFDAFEFKQHRYDARDYRSIKARMVVYEKIFSEYKMDLRKMPVFLETATHDGAPKPGNALAASFKTSPQSEREQAVGLIKVHVYSLANGITKIFWNLLYERYRFAGDPGSDFNFYGLVNNPMNDGKKQPKLAFFAYKKMVEILGKADWKTVETIEETNDVCVFKVGDRNRTIWIAWNDSERPLDILIAGVKSGKVRVTEAIPDMESGSNVGGCRDSFPVKNLALKETTVSLRLDKTPVFVEEE